MDIEDMLARAVKSGKVGVIDRAQRKNRFSPEIEMEMLITESKKLLEVEQFSVGDILTWKSAALAHNSKPSKDGKMVVIEVLQEPIRNLHAKKDGSPYYGEPQQIRAMVIGEEGEALCYLFDATRFKKIGNIYDKKA